MHIGIIGGIGPSSTELYYRELVRQHKSAGLTLELTIVHADIQQLTTNLLQNKRAEQAAIFQGFIEKLYCCGATHVVIPSLAGHFCLQELIQLSPIPIISALDCLKKHTQHNHYSKVGILGTLPTMQTGVFGCFNQDEYVVPDRHDQIVAAETYRRFARNGYASEVDKADIFSIGQKLVEQQSADIVFLAGTDFFLAFDGQECGFHAVDCAQLHISDIIAQHMLFASRNES